MIEESKLNNIVSMLNNINNKLIIDKSGSDELYSIKNAAQKYDVSEVFLRKKIESGDLKVRRAGRAIRIEKKELENLFQKEKK